MKTHGQRRKQQPAAPAAGRHERRLAWAHALQPGAEQRRARAEKHEEQRVEPAQQGLVPIPLGGDESSRERCAGRGDDAVIDPHGLRQWQPEDAEAIRHPDAQMDAQRRRRHEPAVESGRSDRSRPVEQSGHGLPVIQRFSGSGTRCQPAAAATTRRVSSPGRSERRSRSRRGRQRAAQTESDAGRGCQGASSALPRRHMGEEQKMGAPATRLGVRPNPLHGDFEATRFEKLDERRVIVGRPIGRAAAG